MKIGELAQATKISIRTLHHYDEIGLLKPSSRTESSHRLYTESDIARLHKIVSLRNIGFSLEEVGQFVGHSHEELRDLIARQLEKVEVEREELDRKQWCIKAAHEAANFEQFQGSEKLISMIRELTIQSQYLSAEERQIIQSKNNALGLQRIKEMHSKLEQLTLLAQKFMSQNIDPTEPQVIALANEWNALGQEGVGDNPEVVKKIKLMLQENPDLASYRGINQDLLEYLKKAFRSQKPSEA